MLCIISVSLVWTTLPINWLARPYPMMHILSRSTSPQRHGHMRVR